jgi:hypothetical protein
VVTPALTITWSGRTETLPCPVVRTEGRRDANCAGASTAIASNTAAARKVRIKCPPFLIETRTAW